MIHQISEQHVEAQKASGFPFLQGQEATLRALNALWFHAARRGRAPEPVPPPPKSDLTPETLDATLARYGITLPKSREVATAAEAAEAAREIGFPVVLKIRSPDILHKTEAGGVALNLRDAADVAAAAERLIASARKVQPDARIDGFLVQEMASGIEAIVGARSDALYGPMLLVGAGGILVELAKDAALRMLPVSAADVTADGRWPEALEARRRLSRPAARRPRGTREDGAGARPVLPRPPREDRRHRDQSADGRRGAVASTCACCGA